MRTVHEGRSAREYCLVFSPPSHLSFIRTRVLVTAVDAEREDTVLKRRVGRTEDRAVPLVHGNVVAVLEAVRAAAVAETLFALLELLEETEAPGNCGQCGDLGGGRGGDWTGLGASGGKWTLASCSAKGMGCVRRGR